MINCSLMHTGQTPSVAHLKLKYLLGHSDVQNHIAVPGIFLSQIMMLNINDIHIPIIIQETDNI